MKNIITLLVLSMMTCSADLPFDIQRVVDIRAKQIAKIDDAYYKHIIGLRAKAVSDKDTDRVVILDTLLIEYYDSTNTTRNDGPADMYLKSCRLEPWIVGDTAYLDKNAKWNNIPEQYEGWEISKMGLTKFNPIFVKVKGGGMITILTYTKDAVTFKDEGWDFVVDAKHTGVTDGPDGRMQVLVKYFDSGESIKELTGPVTGYPVKLLIDPNSK